MKEKQNHSVDMVKYNPSLGWVFIIIKVVIIKKKRFVVGTCRGERR